MIRGALSPAGTDTFKLFFLSACCLFVTLFFGRAGVFIRLQCRNQILMVLYTRAWITEQSKSLPAVSQSHEHVLLTKNNSMIRKRQMYLFNCILVLLTCIMRFCWCMHILTTQFFLCLFYILVVLDTYGANEPRTSIAMWFRPSVSTSILVIWLKICSYIFVFILYLIYEKLKIVSIFLFTSCVLSQERIITPIVSFNNFPQWVDGLLIFFLNLF